MYLTTPPISYTCTEIYTTTLTLRTYKAKPAGPKVSESQKTNGSSLNNTTGILGSNRPPRRRAPRQGYRP